jgi:hypothetical protein
MLEMCYVPRPWTDLAKLFKANGWKVVTGDQAMIWQGIEVSLSEVSNAFHLCSHLLTIRSNKRYG